MNAERAARVRGLYVIVDPDACAGRAAVEVAGLALEGGASVLQWRDKRRDKGDQLADVRAILALCRAHGAPLLINDHLDLALAIGADGVHLGQHDLPAPLVREIGGGMIIGVSTNNADEARRVRDEGADYVAVGAMFATRTKDVTRAASIERLRQVKAAVTLPVVAIGGIGATNARSVIDAGADAIAVISAVCGAPDPRAAAAELAGLFGDLTPRPFPLGKG